MNKSLDDIIKERKTVSRQTRTGKGPRGGRGRGGRGGNRGSVQASNFNNFQRNEPLVNTRSPLNKRVSQSPIARSSFQTNQNRVVEIVENRSQQKNFMVVTFNNTQARAVETRESTELYRNVTPKREFSSTRNETSFRSRPSPTSRGMRSSPRSSPRGRGSSAPRRSISSTPSRAAISNAPILARDDGKKSSKPDFSNVSMEALKLTRR